MSLRDWRARRIVALSLLWMLAVLGYAVVRNSMEHTRFRQQYPTGELYVMARSPGGAWFLIGPPLLLVSAWWWVRRSRRER